MEKLRSYFEVHSKPLRSKWCFVESFYQFSGSSGFTVEQLIDKPVDLIADFQPLHRSFLSWNWNYPHRRSCFCLLVCEVGKKLEQVRLGCVGPIEIN